MVAALIVLLAGFGVVFYPAAKNALYENEIAQIKEDFLEIPGDNYGALYAFLKAENERLFQTGQKGLTDAFSYEQPAVDLSQYGIKDNCIGFINIPCIKIELPIYLGANSANMMKGAVHLTETSYPIGGQNTNCVIAAHRGQSVRQFRTIDKIQIGDEVILTNFRETLFYKAVQIKIIDPSDIDKILIQPDRDLITLFSCHPLGANYQRYVVYCHRV